MRSSRFLALSNCLVHQSSSARRSAPLWSTAHGSLATARVAPLSGRMSTGTAVPFVIPYRGPSTGWSKIPDADELTSLLQQACLVAQAFAAANPHVENTAALWRKLAADLQFLESCTSPADVPSPRAAALTDPCKPVPVAAAHPACLLPLDHPSRTNGLQPPAAAISTTTGTLSSQTAIADGTQPPEAVTSASTALPPAPHLTGTIGSSAAAPAATTPDVLPAKPLLTLPRVQGIINNLQGFWAEWQAASAAPGVIAVSKKFSTVTQVDLALARQKGVNAGALKRSNIKAEVDVVAQNGHIWIEVKNHATFGVDSSHWLGHKGHVKGLKQQAQELLQAAQAPCNLRRWRAPMLVLYFPNAMDHDLQAELEAMGVVVAVGEGALQTLPPPPQPPAASNLCVTSLCALVSEVSHCDPHAPVMLEWATGFHHWQECLLAEQQEPLLPTLTELVGGGRSLLACRAAVEQFEELLQMWAGPKEAARWLQLLQRLTVLPAAAEALAAADPHVADGVRRVLVLDSIAAHTKEVFAAGDLHRAVTLTANGNAVRSAANQGVHLEATVHRPVWLTGM